jgi:hypothetical protein
MLRKTGTKKLGRKFRGFHRLVKDVDLDLLKKAADKVVRGEPLWYDARKEDEKEKPDA